MTEFDELRFEIEILKEAILALNTKLTLITNPHIKARGKRLALQNTKIKKIK